MSGRYVTDQQKLVAGLAREGVESKRETSEIVAPGGRTAAWAVTVKSHVAYNVYRVRAIVVESLGSVPTEIGAEMEAVNLAEPFAEEGTLAPGVCAVMSRVGERSVFYAVP
ncbi:MAG: hypothetical protein A2Y77_12565 [Planctomycetes bacterium RBG_13_62_9]|nr:MAG: hypothetical protein A2Y77_12565 [Planctomycetes bacterium RBG_13_62_9]